VSIRVHPWLTFFPAERTQFQGIPDWLLRGTIANGENLFEKTNPNFIPAFSAYHLAYGEDSLALNSFPGATADG
jgi:hypothetical protein